MKMKYIHTFGNELKSIFVYRARVLNWVVYDLLSFIVFPFIWLTVYAGRSSIAGFDRADIVTYYILTAYISSMALAHQSRVVRKDIVHGKLNTYLTRPFPYLLVGTIHDTAYHFVTFFIATLVGLAVIFALPTYVVLPRSPLLAALFALSVILTYCLTLCFEELIGLSSFWLGETTGLNQSFDLVTTVLSGQLAPLAFFPLAIQSIARFLPFQYLFYFPTEIYLGKLSSQGLLNGFTIEGLWLLGLVGVILAVWRRGLYRYDGAGM